MSNFESSMTKAVRSLEVVKNAKNYLPSFYTRVEKRKQRKKGTPLVWCMANVPPELLKAFDLPWEWPENYGTLCAAKMVSPHFLEIAEAEGWSRDLCSYLTISMGYCKRREECGGEAPPEAPLEGGMGEPTMLLGSGYLCEPRWKWFQSIGTHYMDIPVHSTDPISPPYDIILDERVSEHYLEALRSSVKEQIVFLEEQTGKKLDMNYFRKIMTNSQKAISLWHSVLKLRTNVPCPMGAPDYFSSIIPQMYMLGEEEAVDFYERLYEEVQQRVDHGIGVIPNEKYRLMWFGIPPWYNLGFFNYLESLGAVVCVEMIYYVGPPIEVDLSDPVEGLIQREWKQAVWRHEHSSETMPELFSPAIFVPSKAVLSWAKDYKIDGAIMHRTRSCRATSVGQVHYKNLLEKDGVPSLIFETDMSDPRNWSDAQIKTRVSAFLELLDSRDN